jgi:flagellar basal body-associated protein FliL
MADDGAAPEGGGKKDRKPLIMSLVVGLVCLLIGGGAMFFLKDTIAGPPAEPEGAEGAAAAPTEAGAAGAAVAGAPAAAKTAVVELESFTLNLKDSAGGRKLAMKLALEGPPTLQAAVELRKAHIRDAVITLASDYSYLDLDGADGRLRLRDEIQRNLNTVLESQGVEVQRVYYTEFVVQ